MAKLLGGRARDWRRSLDTPRERRKARLDSLLVDHAFVRWTHKNRARVGAQAWRSSQPSPGDVAWTAARGVRTIVNFRGARNCGSYLLEKEACEAHGITLIDAPLGSREAPAPERVRALKALLEDAARPLLMHCKSGSDRVGLGAALYLHWVEGQPIAAARRQLSLRHGHIRAGKTGVLDHLFDVFDAQAARGGEADFFAWTQSDAYDPAAIKTEFHAKAWGDLLVDGLLRRE